MDARLREKIAEAIRKLGLEGVSVNIVISDGVYFDRFYLARGLKEDGSNNPERSFKCFGGGLSVHSIEDYIDGNPGFEELVRELDLENRDVLLRLGAVAEVWQEGKFTISPHRLGDLFEVTIRHKLDRDLGAQGKPHIDFWFGISTEVFEKRPVLQENEIHSYAVISILDIERPDESGRVYVTVEETKEGGEQTKRRVRVADDHATAISAAYKRIRDANFRLPVVRCRVVADGEYCVICKKRGDKKDAPRRGVDTLHIPRSKPVAAPSGEESETSVVLPSHEGTTDERSEAVEGVDLPQNPKAATAAIMAKLEKIRMRRLRQTP